MGAIAVAFMAIGGIPIKWELKQISFGFVPYLDLMIGVVTAGGRAEFFFYRALLVKKSYHELVWFALRKKIEPCIIT